MMTYHDMITLNLGVLILLLVINSAKVASSMHDKKAPWAAILSTGLVVVLLIVNYLGIFV
jgi:hypothetical protein